MQTELTVHPFYCSNSKSSSFKIEIKYPPVKNLAYNFELILQVYLQNLLPKISFQLVHQIKYLFPKKQLIIQNLQPLKMYKIQLIWSKNKNSIQDYLQEQKTVFTCSQKLPESQQQEQEIQLEDSAYDKFVKDNINNYFNQYYHQNNPANQRQSNDLQTANNLSQSFLQQVNSDKKQIKKKSSKLEGSFCNSQFLIKSIGQSDPFINKNNLSKYILEGRKSSSIKDFLTTKDFQCFNSHNKLYKNQSERRKHVEKTLLVSKAINMFGQIYSTETQIKILEETSNSKFNQGNQKGKQFFKNDWFMGPFYSYDANQRQLKKGKIEQQIQ